jgi:hypothetical protein
MRGASNKRPEAMMALAVNSFHSTAIRERLVQLSASRRSADIKRFYDFDASRSAAWFSMQ